MAFALRGSWSWRGERDAEGHRSYFVKSLVESITKSRGDGPANALQTPGLPIPGAWYTIQPLNPAGGDFTQDIDLWAWCRTDAQIEPVADGPNNFSFYVTQTFSTKPPPPDQRRCSSIPIEDPILEPQKISGGLTKYTEQGVWDRFGNPIQNSAFEPFRGKENEWDSNRNTIHIEQNVLDLQLDLLSSMRDALNAFPLWGLPPRCIKLSTYHWERAWYGSCYLYYKRTLDFEIRDDSWDRNLLDHGTRCLRGHWDTNPASPTYQQYIVDPDANPMDPGSFVRYRDFFGDIGQAVLDGRGRPLSALMLGLETGQVYSGSGAGAGLITIPIISMDLVRDRTNQFFGFMKVVFGTNPSYSTGQPIAPGLQLQIVNTLVRLKGGTSGFDVYGGYDGQYTVAGLDDGDDTDNTFYVPYFFGVPIEDTKNRLDYGPVVFNSDDDLGIGFGAIQYLPGPLRPGTIHVEKYQQVDFLLLGIPTDLSSVGPAF